MQTARFPVTSLATTMLCTYPDHFKSLCCFVQTAQYSTQIFSLAVLLSTVFVYNQMGGIDEAALDRLSLVTEMTKHIRVKTGKGEVGFSG